MDHVLGGVKGVQKDKGGQDESEVQVWPRKSGRNLPAEAGWVVLLLDHGPASEVLRPNHILVEVVAFSLNGS